MRPDLGRFFEGRLLETIKLLKAIHDVGTGAGPGVAVWIEGRQMIFGKEERVGRGFLRVTPGETNATLAFPRGHQILDPQKRAKGPAGSETRLVLTHASQLDVYVRRMIEAAYALEA